MSTPTYLSKSAFAAHIGRSPSYITWLKENGRLVLSPNGKQVDVLATEALIRDTADPSKAAVAARHQQERLQRDVYSQVSAQSEPTNMAAPPPADPAQGQSPDFQKARAHREHYLARMAEMEFRKAQGELVEISFVQKAAFETARSLNHSLMSLSPQLAPQLAALSDPWEVERQLTAALRQRLNEAAQVSSDDFGFTMDDGNNMSSSLDRSHC